MQSWQKISAGICAALFMVTGVLALLLSTVERNAFSADTYKRALAAEKLYERMPSVLATALAADIAENPNANPYLKVLTEADWERTISSLLPPDELKALTDSAIDSTLDYLNGRTNSVAISLLPLKRQFAGASGAEAIKQLLSAQPACTAEQLMQMGLGLLTGGQIALCNPPEEMLGMMMPAIESQLQAMTAGFPDQITILDETKNTQLNELRTQLDRVRFVLRWSLLLPLIFLFGLTALAVRTLLDWLKWWGVPFLVTGGIVALTALLGSPLLSLLLGRVLRTQGIALLPVSLLANMQETVGAVARQMLAPAAVEGLLLLTAGMVMLLAAVYLSARGKTPTFTS